jgi:hypothetical protein
MRLVKLNDVRRFAMSLPEVTEEPHFAYTSFRVKGKIQKIPLAISRGGGSRTKRKRQG